MLLMYDFTLHGRVLTCIWRCRDELCLLTTDFRSVPELIQLYHTIMLVFNVVLSEGSKVTDIQCWFLAFLTEISEDSLHLLMILD